MAVRGGLEVLGLLQAELLDNDTRSEIPVLVDNFDELGVSLERVVVTELQDKTFYAELHLASAGKDKSVVVVSSRPSDAIALAVRVAAPIFAAEQVLEEAGVILDDSDDDKNREEPS